MTGFMIPRDGAPVPPPTPRRRTVRTFVQVAAGVALGVPAAIVPLGIPADVAAKVSGVCAVFAGLVALVMNEWDKATGKG